MSLLPTPTVTDRDHQNGHGNPGHLLYAHNLEEGMSLLPITNNRYPPATSQNGYYMYNSIAITVTPEPIDARANEDDLVVHSGIGTPGVVVLQEDETIAIRDLIALLFQPQPITAAIFDSSKSRIGSTTKAHPPYPPVKRGKRHRNFYIYQLNQFRHWWKTSRLLVRLSGGYVLVKEASVWSQITTQTVKRHREIKEAARVAKDIGRGGVENNFLNPVMKFTRTIRIVLAMARAWEARIDNRLYEVGIAEAFAFMGNRCSRQIARGSVDWATKHVALPIAGYMTKKGFRHHYPWWDDHPVRSAILIMGFLRAILPFAMSFQGSRIGRQLTFATYRAANYRWKAVQSIQHFHQQAGVYQDTLLDRELVQYARDVATSLGHGEDPVEVRTRLAKLGFELIATGCGGLACYRKILQGDKTMPYNNAGPRKATVITLHITPYGPSVVGEMPRFIVVQRRTTYYAQRRERLQMDLGDAAILDAAIPREAKVQGFTYSGAFFTNQEWAALTDRFQEELESYDNACKNLGTKQTKHNDGGYPLLAVPSDLTSLKDFIRTGRTKWHQRKDDKKFGLIQKEVAKMAKWVAKLQEQGKAPKRVILYLEGLDCAGKSSTGGIICQALEQCGYGVKTAQHNRPPTPEQRAKPWMDRGRFEYPDDMYTSESECPDYAAVVWDRGPAGDFVYGNMDQLPIAEKLQRYSEFREYDEECHRNETLFCKILFVTDKDSIAATLGKRLAQRQISRDLRSWLDANSSPNQERPGLDEIEHHIDPTDFIAFNKLESNLSKFTEVARNTDEIKFTGKQKGFKNPWLVVCTSNRHNARLGILRAFQKQLQQYTKFPPKMTDDADSETEFLIDPISKKRLSTRPVPNNIVEEREHGISLRAVFQTFLLAIILYVYAYFTWDFDFDMVT